MFYTFLIHVAPYPLENPPSNEYFIICLTYYLTYYFYYFSLQGPVHEKWRLTAGQRLPAGGIKAWKSGVIYDLYRNNLEMAYRFNLLGNSYFFVGSLFQNLTFACDKLRIEGSILHNDDVPLKLPLIFRA